LVQVSAGSLFAVARSAGGQVWSWGYNASGQLGIGNATTQSRAVPVKLNGNTPAEYLSDALDISAGSDHVVALRKRAGENFTTVWCWGQQSYGRLGNGLVAALAVTYPVQVQKDASEGGGYLQDIVQVAAGSQHTLALDKDGQVWAWGDNGYGALGDGGTTNRAYAKRVMLNAMTYLDNVVSIAAGGTSNIYGYGFSLALLADGSVVTWGYNASGQLGNGVNTTTAKYASASVTGPLNNQPPTGTLSISGAPCFAPATVTLSAAAADSDGAVARVDFYRDSQLVASDTVAPFQTQVSGIGEGAHTFRAVVVDDSGAIVNTNEIPVTVVLPTIGVAAQIGTVAENSAVPGSFRISRSAGEPTTNAINIRFTFSGTATPGEDYEAPEIATLIPSGAAYVDIPNPLTDPKRTAMRLRCSP
ncbi:MAG: hypothetical protein LC104_01295, partial [Bacteroidales bacterium]|nr:hypothetical protein [Bacteroidales bacterium]